MENKSLYCVCGYIPSDENRVVINVHQMLKMGCETDGGYKYCWATITRGSGIGFALPIYHAFHNSVEDALLSLFKIVKEDYMKIDKMSFEEMIVCYNDMKQKISKDLK